MQGIVKWFSKGKGYGYIISEQGDQYDVDVRDIAGIELLSQGDGVCFDRSASVADRAINVRITSPARDTHSHARTDDREQCASCGKTMVPRLNMYRGKPQNSFCPFCGAVHKDFTVPDPVEMPYAAPDPVGYAAIWKIAFRIIAIVTVLVVLRESMGSGWAIFTAILLGAVWYGKRRSGY